MKKNKIHAEEAYSMNVVDLAYQIINMHHKIIVQAAEIERLEKIEKDHRDLLDSSIQHNQHMAGNLLKLVLVPGVLDACQKNNPFKKEEKTDESVA